MGQKVNPHGLRVGVIKDWDAKWYAEDDFADNLVEDYNIRKFLKNKLYAAGISKIETERASDRLKIVIHTAKPGIVIGKGGAEIENLKKQVEKLTSAKKLSIDIKEVKKPDTEFYSEGTIPLQTLRADIDYGFAEADTTYGKVGVKVWIYEGEVLPTKTNANANVEKEGSDK